jgi:hypothetical protein
MIGDVQPLQERLADGDVRPRVPLGVHLTLQEDQLDLGIGVGTAGLAESPVLPRHDVEVTGLIGVYSNPNHVIMRRAFAASCRACALR